MERLDELARHYDLPRRGRPPAGPPARAGRRRARARSRPSATAHAAPTSTWPTRWWRWTSPPSAAPDAPGRPRRGRGLPRPRRSRSPCPATEVVLVESVQRKAAFIRGAAAELELANVRVEARPGRGVGDGPRGLRRRDGARPGAADGAARVRGAAAARRRRPGRLEGGAGRRPSEADARGRRATLGHGEPVGHAVDALRRRARASLYVSSKVMDTPAGYPRREGMARKRPLRALDLSAEDFGPERIGGARLTGRDASLGRGWEPSTRSPIRRVGWGRPPPPSTSPRASRRPASRRCSSTSTRRRTRRSASGTRRTPSRASTTSSAATRPPRTAVHRDVDQGPLAAPRPPRPRGRERRAAARAGLRVPAARRAGRGARPLLLRAARLPAVARPADRQRARRGRPRDRAGADRVLRARGARRACSTR